MFVARVFTGPIPKEIGALTALTRLDLRYTNIEGPVPDLSSLLKLTYLGITQTNIARPRCDIIIPQLPLGITRIDLGTCNEGVLPNRIDKLEQLTKIVMFDIGTFVSRAGASDGDGETPTDPFTLLPKLSGTIPPTIGALTNLDELHLSGTLLSGTIPPTISALVKITNFWVLGKKISGSIPGGISKLIDLKSLFGVTSISGKSD